MAEINKPSGLNVIWAANGDVLNPGDAKYQSGWGPEIPPRQWENFKNNKQDTAIAHINQHGVPVWDADTEYRANKSYVQGQANGTIYRCILTHTNQNPDDDVTNTYWIIAFASAGDFYTKTEADSTYLAKSQNLADVDASLGRTNLSVYAKSETYTKSQVDSKTTVSNALQAQEQTSNSTLLTPLRLADSFKGANQSIGSTAGAQTLPGGFTFQYGIVNAASATTGSVIFTKEFPSFCFGVYITDLTVSPSAVVSFGTDTPTTTGFTWYSTDGAGGFSWFAIGI